MIKTTILCDRCKKILQHRDKQKLVISQYYDDSWKAMDLCNECYKELSDWYYQNCEKEGKNEKRWLSIP